MPASKKDNKMQKALELIGSITCPFVQRVQMVLMAKELNYTFTPIDLNHKPDWFKEVSPYGKVPVLRHKNNYLYESSVINEYLEEVFPKPALWPADALLRAQARIWINYCDNQFLTHYFQLLKNQDKNQMEELTDTLIASLKFMEKEGLEKLSDKGPFWLGEKLSLLDAAIYPFFERFPMLEHYRKVSIPQSYQRLLAWIAHMQQQTYVINSSNPLAIYLKVYAKYANA